VKVENVNEAPSYLSLSASSVLENTIQVGICSADDPENDTLTWSIVGGGCSFFQISSSGSLSFLSAPDYERPLNARAHNLYQVKVRGSDGEFVVEDFYLIEVTDANEPARSEFRSQFQLAADGSDDFSDWSGDGVSNICYFAFGLGDPASPVTDRSRFPKQVESMDESYVYSFVQPASGDFTGLSVTVLYSEDFGTWRDVLGLGSTNRPESISVDELGDGYERVTLTFDLEAGASKMFHRLSVREGANQ